MKKYLLLLAFFRFCSLGFSQLPTDRPLNAVELAEQKWYYSIDSAMAEPEKVYKLSLVEMNLKEIPAEVFTFTNLQELTLSQNKIKKIPADIGNLKRLQLLSLYKNKLRSIPLEMRNLTNLTSLYLGKNKLMELPIWVGGMGKLRKLDLSHNRITPLELDHITNLLPQAEITH